MSSIRKKSGKPVRGTMNPFRTEIYKSSLSVVLGRSEVYDDFYKYRTICKNYVVDRVRVSAKLASVYKPFPLSQIEEYLLKCGYDNDYIHFIMCLYRDYSHPNECIYFVDQNACLKSSDTHIAIQASIQDVKKLMKDVTKIAKRISSITTMQSADHNAIGNQYKFLQDSVEVFINTIKALYHGELPTRLKNEDYMFVLNLDAKLANYYYHDGISYTIKTKSKKPLYRQLNNSAAATLALIAAISNK